MVQGEMGVARVNPYRFGQRQPAVLSALFRPRRPTAVTQFPGEGGGGRLEACLLPAPARWTTSIRPGLQRALGDGDDVWRGQTEKLACHLLPGIQ